MKKGRFSEAQIVAILQQQASGQTVAQIVREHGLSEATFYAWKSKLVCDRDGRDLVRRTTSVAGAPHSPARRESPIYSLNSLRNEQ